MEMSPIYTDMHFKTMPAENDQGRRSERQNKQMIVQQYRKRARSTKDSRHRLTTPGRSRLLAVKIRTYDYLYAEKRTARPCAEQGRKQAPSSTKNKVEAVAAAKWARTWVIYTRYAPTCIYIYYLHYFLCARSKRGSRHRRRRNRVEAVAATKWLRTYVVYIHLHAYIPVWIIYFSLCAEQGREQAPSATNQSRGSSGCKVVTYVRNIYIYTHLHVYIPVWILFFSLCAEQRRKQAPPAMKSRR